MTVQSRVDQCKVVWYQWVNKVNSSDSALDIALPISGTIDVEALADAEAFDISDHIASCTFTKSMSEAAGSFSITLGNSLDWARYIQPGEWLLIFMSSAGDLPLPGGFEATKPEKNRNNSAAQLAKKAESLLLKKNENIPKLPKPSIDLSSQGDSLRCIGMVERVAIRTSVNESGAIEINYVVTGKDFGVCLEDTDLWVNFFFQEKAVYKAVVQTYLESSDKNLKDLLSKYFNIFFSPEKTVLGAEAISSNQQLIENFKQWLLPAKLLNDVKIDYEGAPYFGNISKLLAFTDTLFENVVKDPLAGLSGSPWEVLKDLSEPSFHEFFCELKKGEPKVVFRPIPWAINKQGYPNLAPNIAFYIELAEGATPSLVSIESVKDKAFSLKEELLSSAPPVPGFTSAQALSGLTEEVEAFLKKEEHAIDLGPSDVLDIDVGPDFHNRFNHFLVTNSTDQPFSLIHAITQNTLGFEAFPYKNEAAKKRHGLRKKHILTNAFLYTSEKLTSKLLGSDPNVQLLKELNALIKDYWGFSENFYSGSLSILGNYKTRVGKVLVTNSETVGIANMVFYIEEYTDSFTVSEKGVGSWVQEVSVTRGIELSDLKGASDFSSKNPSNKTDSFVRKA